MATYWIGNGRNLFDTVRTEFEATDVQHARMRAIELGLATSDEIVSKAKVIGTEDDMQKKADQIVKITDQNARLLVAPSMDAGVDQ